MGRDTRGREATFSNSTTPLVFLDFDGVLNSIQSAIAFGTTQRFCPVAVGLVAALCRKTGAQIVVSSSWRPENPGRLFDLEKNMLRVGAADLVPYLIGYTPRLRDTLQYMPPRGAEVQLWRERNGHTGTYVILDDDDDALQGQPWVQTSQGRGFGLCEYIRALDHLAPKHASLTCLRPFGKMALGGQRTSMLGRRIPIFDEDEAALKSGPTSAAHSARASPKRGRDAEVTRNKSRVPRREPFVNCDRE